MIIEQESYPLIAKTMAGLENVLAEELKLLEVNNIVILKRAVGFEATKEQMYRANYECRTALRILKPIHTFTINTEQEFYDEIFKICWEDYFTFSNTIAVDATLGDSLFTHSQFVALRCKDAIVDRFRENFNRRPSVDTEKPNIRINIHMYKNECHVSLDSSGISLHKRGYRIGTSEAPMSEVLAAGMISLSGWDKKTDFLDFMCGSGTLAIEAAMMASNIPAGYYREFFGFMRWQDFDSEMFDKIKKQAKDNIIENEGNIVASDISDRAINVAMLNIRNARLHKDIILERKSLSEQRPMSDKCMIISNPPYGERIQPEDIIQLYQEIGDTLKRNFSGCEAWIISSAFDVLKFIGLRPSKKIILFNGPLECRFVKFEMYQGSKRIKEDKDVEAE